MNAKLGAVFACLCVMYSMPSLAQEAPAPISYDEALGCYGILREEEDRTESMDASRALVRVSAAARSLGEARGKTADQISAEMERTWQRVYDYNLAATRGAGDPAAVSRMQEGVRGCLARFAS